MARDRKRRAGKPRLTPILPYASRLARRRIGDGVIPEYGFKPSEVNFEPILTSVSSVAFLAINLWYLRHLLRRTYTSPPPNPALGDSFNDAGILAIRVVSLGAVMIAGESVRKRP